MCLSCASTLSMLTILLDSGGRLMSGPLSPYSTTCPLGSSYNNGGRSVSDIKRGDYER